MNIMIWFVWIVLSSYVAADFVTGFFHWLEDTYGTEQWGNWLYRNIVLPNIEHHEAPAKLTRGSWWSRVELSVYLAAPFVITGLLTHWYWLVWFGLFASQANEIHCWAHRSNRFNPWPVRMLQRFGIVQRARHHGLHHREPFTSRYCVMTPWLNPILDGVGFWRGLERCMAMPKRVTEGGV